MEEKWTIKVGNGITIEWEFGDEKASLHANIDDEYYLVYTRLAVILQDSPTAKYSDIMISGIRTITIVKNL
jgi:hypothetical protein